MSLVTVEEYCEKHELDSNYLYLMVAACRQPHKKIFGRTYVDDQILEKMEAEERYWRRQFPGEGN